MLKKQTFNAAFTGLGALGLVALFFPWYTVVSSGMGITYTGETILGFSAVNTSIFGYLLYVLPAALLAMVFVKNINLSYKNKCLAGAGIGVVEIICWFIVHSAVQSTNVDIGFVSAKWESKIGRTIALIVYIATIAASLFLYVTADKEEKAEN